MTEAAAGHACQASGEMLVYCCVCVSLSLYVCVCACVCATHLCVCMCVCVCVHAAQWQRDALCEMQRRQ